MIFSKRLLVKLDFDAWGYNIFWPQEKKFLPLLGFASLTVEDIKFAYNAWCLLRLAMFYGTEHPKVLSSLTRTTPSMDIAYGGNRLFYMHAEVNGKLSPNKTRVALSPCHPKAQVLQHFPWRQTLAKMQKSEGVEIILGMENGLSQEIIDQSDYCLYIPQYGSIGSLSMLSALAIAIHSAHSAYHAHVRDAELAQPLYGHMPWSNRNCSKTEENSLPHEKDLVHLSNDDIAKILESRRAQYPLQLSVMVYNEFGDRNIGAIMRNANAFNCERMVIVNRKKFNRRGAVGTQKLLSTSFHPHLENHDCRSDLHGYSIWLLYQYYPYLKIHNAATTDTNATFIRPENENLRLWLRDNHCMSPHHPMRRDGAGAHLIGNEVYLDHFHSVQNAVQEVAREGSRGIMLVVPEEGASPHPELVKLAQRVVYVVHPDRLAAGVQRGLNGALSSAIALERIRTAIDSLPRG